MSICLSTAFFRLLLSLVCEAQRKESAAQIVNTVITDDEAAEIEEGVLLCVVGDSLIDLRRGVLI